METVTIEMSELDKISDSFADINARLTDHDSKFALSTVEPTEEEKEAELSRARALDGLAGLKVWDIPLGQGLVGGFSAVVVSELVDGFMAAQSNMVKGLVKLAGAGVAVRWGGRLLGTTGSRAVAVLLAYDGLRMMLPIDEMAHKVATALTGVIPTGGLGGRAGQTNVGEPERSPADYYAGLSGGGR